MAAGGAKTQPCDPVHITTPHPTDNPIALAAMDHEMPNAPAPVAPILSWANVATTRPTRGELCRRELLLDHKQRPIQPRIDSENPLDDDIKHTPRSRVVRQPADMQWASPATRGLMQTGLQAASQ
eukprot:jgi/Tetstr1/459423/TSEL_000436.t2